MRGEIGIVVVARFEGSIVGFRFSGSLTFLLASCWTVSSSSSSCICSTRLTDSRWGWRVDIRGGRGSGSDGEEGTIGCGCGSVAVAVEGKVGRGRSLPLSLTASIGVGVGMGAAIDWLRVIQPSDDGFGFLITILIPPTLIPATSVITLP